MPGKKYRNARDRIRLSAGDVVRVGREMLGMTQTELAKRASLRQSHLSEIENGKRIVGRAVAEKLAKALDLPASHILFAGENVRPGVEQVDVLVSEVMKRVKMIGRSHRVMTRKDEDAILDNLKRIRRAVGS
jgi:transcriptional regulator with XRE-family HTH domain